MLPTLQGAQDRIEESRFFKVFTKLRALEQTDFEKAGGLRWDFYG